MEKAIINHLPKDYQVYFSSILFAYYELKRGSELDFFKYEVFDDSLPILSNDKNYDRKLKRFKDNFKVYEQFLPKNTELSNLPKHPKDIKLQLEKNLAGYTSDDNILKIIEALFGTGGEKRDNAKATVRRAKKNYSDKFEISMASQIRKKQK